MRVFQGGEVRSVCGYFLEFCFVSRTIVEISGVVTPGFQIWGSKSKVKSDFCGTKQKSTLIVLLASLHFAGIDIIFTTSPGFADISGFWRVLKLLRRREL